MLRAQILSKKNVLVFGSIIIIAAILVLILITVLNQSTFYDNISIEGINISKLKKDEAQNLLNSKLAGAYSGETLSLVCNDKVFTFMLRDISFELKVEESIEQAYKIGRTGSVFRKLKDITDTKVNARNVIASVSYNEKQLSGILENIRKEIDTEAKSAEVSYSKGKITLEKEDIGQVLEVDKNMELIENYISNRQFKNINLFVEKNIPRVTLKDVKEIKHVISEFSTRFNVQDANRVHNLKLGCERLNKFILFPNEVFSMSKVLGPRTLDNGYKEAPVILKNELVPGAGGGVCQITTTLYNAVLISKMKVLERTPHSMPLGYVEPGRDATIAENYIDFKFQNNTNYPISINAEITKDTMNLRILGKEKENKNYVKITSVIKQEFVPGDEEVIIDSTLPDDEKQVVREAKKGLSVVIYRDTYNSDNALIDREKISEDVYKPIRQQVKVNENYYKTYR